MHLFVSDDIDLPLLREALLELPPSAYGQVFIESDGLRTEELEEPPGVMVTWLFRQADEEGEPPAAGSLAAVAAGGWASEWMLSSGPAAHHPRVWVGASVRSSVHALIERDGCPCQHHQQVERPPRHGGT